MKVSKAFARDRSRFQNRLEQEIAMEITVMIKQVYGNRAIYPACSKSKLLAEIAGTKTFTSRALDSIKALGYSIQVKQQEVTI